MRIAGTAKEGARSVEWVERLPAVLESMNSEVTRLTGKELEKAVEATEGVKAPSYHRPVRFAEVRLPFDVLVRYLYAPGELEGGERHRATDPVWSLETFGIERSVVSSGQPVLYCTFSPQRRLAPNRGFVKDRASRYSAAACAHSLRQYSIGSVCTPSGITRRLS